MPWTRAITGWGCRAIVSMKRLRPTVIAVALALLVQFVIVPAAPKMALFATALVVVCSIILSWVLRDRKEVHTAVEVD